VLQILIVSQSLSRLRRPLQRLAARIRPNKATLSHGYAQQQYCVRPNSGRIEPGESIEVQGKIAPFPSHVLHSVRHALAVLLQPMKEDPPLVLKCKDKFLVQSTLITSARENTVLNDLVSIPMTMQLVPDSFTSGRPYRTTNPRKSTSRSSKLSISPQTAFFQRRMKLRRTSRAFTRMTATR
jgi:hypothetical protein